MKIKCIESVSVSQSNCENLHAESTYFFMTTDIFYATKLKSMNNCTVLKCFDKFN